MALEITGFTKNIIECQSTLSGECCPIDTKLSVKPWAYKINTHGGKDNCEFIVKRRPEKGWSLDFVFNRETLPWSSGGPFYFLGVREENNAPLYADNNLSFRFTSDGKIEWRSYRYSGECTNESYVETFYVSSGQTPTLCTDGTLKDFNITIVFDRHLRHTDCEIENAGGWNDLITGETITNARAVTLSGATKNRQYIEELNKDWNDERYARLGVLKIYLNGRPIYKIDNWEEIIPSNRGTQPFIQLWGGGASGSGGIHTGINSFNLKRIKYIEEPLNALQVKHHYLVSTKPNYTIDECVTPCVETITQYVDPTYSVETLFTVPTNNNWTYGGPVNIPITNTLLSPGDQMTHTITVDQPGGFNSVSEIVFSVGGGTPLYGVNSGETIYFGDHTLNVILISGIITIAYTHVMETNNLVQLITISSF